jgi:hypothetical protein
MKLCPAPVSNRVSVESRVIGNPSLEPPNGRFARDPGAMDSFSEQESKAVGQAHLHLIETIGALLRFSLRGLVAMCRVRAHDKTNFVPPRFIRQVRLAAWDRGV